MADEKNAAEAAAPKAPKIIMGFSLPIFALIVFNLLVMLGGVGFLAWFKLVRHSPVITETQAQTQILQAAKPAIATPENTGIFTEVYSERTINIRSAPGTASHYATVEVAVECGNEKCLAGLKNIRAKVEDAIQSTFAQRSYTELATVEAKFRLRHEILSKINSNLKEAPATDLYFTSIVIQ